MVNVFLGAPFQRIMQEAIQDGYASSKTEVIRQALVVYEREIRHNPISRLEAKHIQRHLDQVALKVKRGEIKAKALDELLREYDLDDEGYPNSKRRN